jgi:hypothetical protein
MDITVQNGRVKVLNVTNYKTQVSEMPTINDPMRFDKSPPVEISEA